MKQLDTEHQVLFHINRPTDFYRELKITVMHTKKHFEKQIHVWRCVIEKIFL